MAKILIIDDEPDMRNTLSLILKEEGYKVDTASDGISAIEKIKKDNINIVISDIRMPDMDGLEILARIKAIKPSIPVIMVTGYGNVDSAVEAMKRGAFEYLSKPFDNEKLFEVVQKALKYELVQASEKGGIVEKRVAGKLIDRQETSVKTVAYSKKTSKNTKILYSILILICLSTIAYFAYNMYFWKEKRHKVIYSHPSGIAFDNEFVWVCDWVDQTIYKHKLDSKLTLEASYKLPDGQVSGIAVTPSSIFTCDSLTKKIYEHNKDENLTVRLEVKSPGPSPSGIYWDGKYLWSCDSSTKKIYKHYRDSNLTVVETYPAPGPFPVGLYWDGVTLWSADSENVEIYQHRMDRDLSVVNVFSLPPVSVSSISAFSIRKNIAWIGSDTSNIIFLYQLKFLKKKIKD